MDTSISNAFDAKHILMFVAAAFGGVVIAVVFPKVLNVVASYQNWYVMVTLVSDSFNHVATSINNDSFASAASVVDAGSIVSALVALAYPIHLVLRYLIKGLGGDPESIFLFRPFFTKWLAFVSIYVTAASLCLGIGTKVYLAEYAAGNKAAWNAAIIAMGVSLIIIPAGTIMSLVFGVKMANAEPETLQFYAYELVGHPLLAYPLALVMSVVAVLMVVIPFTKFTFKLGWNIFLIVVMLYLMAAIFVLMLVSAFL